MTESPDRDSTPTTDDRKQPSTPYPLYTLIGGARFVWVLPIVSTFLAAVVLLISGTIETVQMILLAIGLLEPGHDTLLRTLALEVVDSFLVGLVLYVLSLGFYQILIAPDLPVPEWLRIRSPADMESKLIGVIVTVIAVSVLVRVANWDGTSNLTGFGISAASLIAALALYVWAHARANH